MPPLLPLNLRGDFDIMTLKAHYNDHGWVQVFDFLTQQSAQSIYDILAVKTPWMIALMDSEAKPSLLSPQAAKSLPPEQLDKLMHDNTVRASKGFAYSYACYPMIEARDQGWDIDHPLHDITRFLNSEAVLTLLKSITNQDTVRSLDCQATCYRPNDFLTLHDDMDKGQRVCAYTLGLTPFWRADWGGQLLFHADTGDITKGLMPRFNALTLFKVPVSHSVAPIAPYAQALRFSITGWALKA